MHPLKQLFFFLTTLYSTLASGIDEYREMKRGIKVYRKERGRF